MSSIAVFLILGGATAFAAKKITGSEIAGNAITTGKLKKEAVTAAKIKGGSITTSKIANDAVTGEKANESTFGEVPTAAKATTATTAANANALGGKPATAYAASSVIRSVSVKENGTVVAASSDGIVQANVSRTSAGFYCVKGLSPNPVTAVATIGFGADVNSDIYLEVESGGGCQISLAAYNSAATPSDEPFKLIVH
jgi:hypothetical protein